MKNDDARLDALGQIEGLQAGEDQPTNERLATIRQLVNRSISPVRPLPSSGVLVLLTLVCFLGFAGLATIPVGFFGYRHLSADQKLVYYSVILLCSALLSAATVQEVIPGSRRRFSPAMVIVIPIAAMAVVVVALFPATDFVDFVRIGLPCLKLGTLCAAVIGGLGYLLFRKGLSTAPVRTAAVGGLLAGLAGFAVLALHCPVQNFAHILVWHLGAVVLAGTGGALIAFVRTRWGPTTR